MGHKPLSEIQEDAKRAARARRKKAPKPKRGRTGAGRRAKARANAFRALQENLSEVMRIAPAVDESLSRRLEPLERDMRRRKNPKPPRKKKERGA